MRPHLRIALLAMIGFSIGGVSTAYSDVTFAPRFSDHMVIQREMPIVISGKAEGNAEVAVTLADQKATCVAAADGTWQAVLKPLPAGGPFRLQATAGKDTSAVDDVLIGDVWLCAGQSNMQWSVTDSHGAKEALASVAAMKNVRLLQLPKQPAKTPQPDVQAKWLTVTAESAAPFSAVGFHFARALRADHKLDGVPIGLIDNAFGGTAAEAWISQETLKERFKPEELLDSIFGIKPSELFNGMLVPILDTPLKGVLWYQGESNAPKPALYKQVLTTMIEEWRRCWRQPELPFLIVQLPGYPGHKGMETFAPLREAQEQVAKSTPHCWLATVIDTPESFDLHPKHKPMVGERLSLLARRHVYRQDIVASGPVVSAITAEAGGRMRVSFATAGSTLLNRNAPGPLRGFMLAGADGRYWNAAATIEGDAVVLTSDHVTSPVTVRYAWLADPDADLQNKHGLPAAPFRSDSFPVEPPVELQRVPAVRRVLTSHYEATISGTGALASLTVDGRQMLSNEAMGGLTIGGFWGPRSLFYVTERSPRDITFTDGGVDLSYSFSDDAVTVLVTNKSGEATTARLHCSGIVKVGEGSPAVATRDNVALALGGFEAREEAQGGTLLLVKVPPQDQRELRFKVEPHVMPAK